MRSTKERQIFFLDKATKVASKSTMTQKHGCVIVFDDNIIAEGWNKVKMNYHHAYSIHAEVDAIKKCKKKYKDIFSEAELYVVRLGPISLKNSKPCEDCQKVISSFGFNIIYYSTDL